MNHRVKRKPTKSQSIQKVFLFREINRHTHCYDDDGYELRKCTIHRGVIGLESLCRECNWHSRNRVKLLLFERNHRPVVVIIMHIKIIRPRILRCYVTIGLPKSVGT